MKTTKITVKVQKVDGEWQAVVYVNGKRDDVKTYYTLGDDKAAKQDAQATAADMQKKYTETQEFCCQSMTRKEIYDALTLYIDGNATLEMADLTDIICEQYTKQIGEIGPCSEDRFADAVLEVAYNTINALGIKMEGK